MAKIRSISLSVSKKNAENCLIAEIYSLITRRQILDSSKLKEFADNNFKLNENGRKFFKWVENAVGKGESVCYEQFSFSHCVSERLVSQGRQKVPKKGMD